MNPTAKNYGSADARLYTFKIKIKKAVEAPNPLQPPCSTLLQCFLSIFYRRLRRRFFRNISKGLHTFCNYTRLLMTFSVKSYLSFQFSCAPTTSRKRPNLASYWLSDEFSVFR